MTDDDRLLELATAVADGDDIDWGQASQTMSCEESRHVIDRLHAIATVTRPRPALDRPRPASGSLVPGEPGSTGGPLRILDKIDEGMFGDVYRAWDNRLDREVALKLLRETAPAEQASIVVQEGSLLARVRHPGVVTVYGAERIDGRTGIWMEFVHGTTLESELRARGPFALDDAAAAGVALADALGSVHHAGLVHGDIKAQNVIRDETNRLVLTDFGSSCDTRRLSAARSTATPLCAAPEVLRGSPATAQSDIYSLGVLLYRLVTGTYPVEGLSLQQVREAHALGRRRRLDEAQPGLPAAFVAAVERALMPSLDQRFRTAREMEDALRALLPPGSSAAGPVTTPAGNASPRSRLGTLVSGIAIAFVLMGGMLGTRASAPRADGVPLITVVPLRDLSGAGQSEPFVEGLTNEIVNGLGSVEGLEVRSSGLTGTTGPAPEAARESTTHVLSGSVLRSGDALRVRVHLVRVADGATIWSQQFDRAAQSIFAIEDEISQSIVNQLRLKLGGGRRRYETNAAVYEHYLVARALVDRRRSRDSVRAADELERVIAADPGFAPAYAGLAMALEQLRADASLKDFNSAAALELAARQKQAMERALQLDPLLAEAYVAQGCILARQTNWTGAEAAFRRAISLNPRFVAAYTRFATSTLVPLGRLQEAWAMVDTGLKIDPLSLDARRALARIQLHTGQYDAALDNYRRIVADDPEFPLRNRLRGQVLIFKGRIHEAVELLRQDPGDALLLAYSYAISGDRARALALAAREPSYPLVAAFAYAGLNDTEKAIDALMAAASTNPWGVAFFLTGPEFSRVRTDPRIARVNAMLNMPATPGDELRNTTR